MLAIVLMFGAVGTAVHAADTAAGEKAKFTDTSSHWANKYITKMALLDIVRGYTDGSFRPDNPVSRQEAVLMALRLLGLEDDAETASVNAVYGFETDAYFKPYVDYAFSIGLLSNLEELSSYGRAKWGTSPASREWIAKLTIRVIQEEERATSSIQFSDRDDISAWAVGYVNAAAELGIVTGSNGAFYPHRSVTRAELATFFSRAEPLLAERSPRIAEGVVTAADNAGLTITDAQGNAVSFIYAAAPALYSYAQNTPIARTDIRAYSRVLVIQDAGVAYYVEVLAEQQAETKKGTILYTDIDDLTVGIDVGGAGIVFQVVPSSTRIVTADGAGGLDFNSLVPGSEVEVTYVTVDGQYAIQQLKVLSVPLNKVSTGTVQRLSVNAGLLTVIDDESGELEEYALDEAILSDGWTAVYGDRTVTLEQISVGDEIRYEVENSIVTDIELLRPVHPILQAKKAVVLYSDAARKMIFVRTEDNAMIGYEYAAEVEVTLEGKANPTLADIEEDDEITMYLDETNKVVKIEIANRSITTKFLIPYLNYYDQQKTLIVLDTDQKITPYYITDDTVVTYNGSKVDHSQITKVFKENDRIDMTFSTVTNEIISLSNSDTYRGTISAIDPNALRVSVILDSGYEVALPLNTQTTYEMIDVRPAKLLNFRVGDTVTATLNEAKTAVGSLKKIVTREYTIAEIQTSTRKIVVLNDAQQKEDHTVPSTAVIRRAEKQNATFQDLKAGDQAIVTFVGRTVANIDVPRISFGRVTAVNEDKGTFTLADYNDGQNTKTFELKGLTLSVNDRVSVVQHVDGTLSVQPLVSFEKLYWKSEPKEKAIYFLKKTISEKNKFQLHEKAIIRKNNAVVDASALSYGATVTGYLYNDAIIEIVIH
jgi:hypothetical protein